MDLLDPCYNPYIGFLFCGTRAIIARKTKQFKTLEVISPQSRLQDKNGITSWIWGKVVSDIFATIKGKGCS
jgi:hypothetical protein